MKKFLTLGSCVVCLAGICGKVKSDNGAKGIGFIS